MVDGYVRVSHVGHRSGVSFISPAVQREQIEEWAALHNAHIGEMFEELDESGARTDRPLLEAAIARVEAQESQGIIVAKLDRFGRSLIHGLGAIERITQAGGTFVSVQDGLDFSTDTGRLVLRLMLSMAEWEHDRIRSNWAAAQARAIARGVPLGPAPVGYKRDRDGRLKIDPVLGPLVTELFKRRAGGAPLSELQRWMADQGVLTPTGRSHWVASSIGTIFRSRVYLGEVRHGKLVNEQAHEPLTDAATWQRAHRPVERPPVRRAKSQSLLRGILRCAACQGLMTATSIKQPGNAGQRTYACPRGDTSLGSCSARAWITDANAEPYVEALFWQELGRAPAYGAQSKVLTLETRLAEQETALADYRDNIRIARTLGAARFEEGLKVRAERIEHTLLDLHAARRSSEGPALPPPDVIRLRWPAMSMEERRATVAEVIECIFVRAGRGQPAERMSVFLRGQAPADLPTGQRPRRLAELKPFDPERHRGVTRLIKRNALPWSERRLREELEVFLDGRACWPTFADFQQLGEALLYRQVQLQGGNRRWARKWALRWEAPLRQRGAWPDDRIRRELATYLEGKSTWPRSLEFRAAGLRRLREAVGCTGGAERWASEFGLLIPPHRRTIPRPWTSEVIEEVLREFTAGRDDWPPKRDFYAAGLIGLYTTIQSRGERQLWAKRLGLKAPEGRITGAWRWTDEMIERELRALTQGQTRFPTRAEFIDAGAHLLYGAMLNSAPGLNGWAKRVDLPRTVRRLPAPAHN